MLIIYRCGTFGYYLRAKTRNQYNWFTGNLAWSSNLPSECCWIVPGTIQPDDYLVCEYCKSLEK